MSENKCLSNDITAINKIKRLICVLNSNISSKNKDQ